MKTTVLVSCVSKKRPCKTIASDLYVSDWFIKARAYAELFGDQWFILSAKYGLLHPNDKIETYDMMLGDLTRDERIAWSQQVFSKLKSLVPSGKIVILAGYSYREHLVPLLSNYEVVVPMEGLGIGRQLSWLKKQIACQSSLF